MSNSARSIIALITLGVMGVMHFLILPLFVGVVTEEWSLTTRQTGFLAASDLIGSSLSAIAAVVWVRRLDWRKLASISIAVIIGGNALSVFVDNYGLLLFVRCMTGLGEGMAVSLSLAGLGDTRNPERSFGFYLSTLTLSGGLVLMGLPALLSMWGVDAIYWGLAALGAFIFPMIWFWVPAPQHAADSASRQPLRFSPRPVLGLAGVFVYFVGSGAVWAYLERMGQAQGHSLNFIGLAIALHLIVAFTGSLVAAWLDVRFGRLIPLTIATVGGALALVPLFAIPTAWSYAGSVILLGFFWNFIFPYHAGTVSHADTSRRLIVMINPMYALGSAVGPLVGALFLTGDNYVVLGYFCAVAGVVSLLLFYPIVRQNREKEPSLYV